MGDGEVFETFMRDEMVSICRSVNLRVQFRGAMHAFEHILYKWLRCELAHDARLPDDIRFEPHPDAGSTHMRIGHTPDGALMLSHSWLPRLMWTVVSAPENTDQFGTPPKFPLPIQLSSGLAIEEGPEEGN